jgi:hypothetical protein
MHFIDECGTKGDKINVEFERIGANNGDGDSKEEVG